MFPTETVYKEKAAAEDRDSNMMLNIRDQTEELNICLLYSSYSSVTESSNNCVSIEYRISSFSQMF